MSFITRTHLSRRTFLHGVGITLAVPFLDSMVPALARGQSATAARERASAASTSRMAPSCRSGRRKNDGRGSS